MLSKVMSTFLTYRTVAEINTLHIVPTITAIIKAKLYSGCVHVLWFERITMPKTLQIMQFVLLLVKLQLQIYSLSFWLLILVY